METSIIVSGFGGQGALFAGQLLAYAAMDSGRSVTWIPSYGPEMRGGTANCHVNIRDIEVGSPMVSNPTVLIALNRPSMEKFENELRPGGLLIYDTSLIDVEPRRKDIETLPIPATKMADELGNTRVANMLVIGAYIGYTGLLGKETVYESLKSAVKHKRFMGINQRAVDAGYEFGLKNRK